MAFLPKGPQRKKRRIFRPLFLLIIWGLVALLLLVNGVYEAKRLKDNLYLFLYDEGAALIAGMEKSVQGVFTSMAALEAFPEASALLFSSAVNPLALDDSVVDLILDIALQIDQEIGSLPDGDKTLSAAARRWHLSRLAWIRPERTLSHPASGEASPGDLALTRPLLQGRASYAIRRSEKKATGQMDHLTVAVTRRSEAGVLFLQVEEPALRLLRRRLLLQGLIEEWRGRGEIRYITFQGENLEVWAASATEEIGKVDEDDFARRVLEKGAESAASRRLRGEEILEVGKAVALGPGSRALLRVGLSTDRVRQVLVDDRRNTALFSLFLLVFGGAGIAFVSRMENRHLARVAEMEDKVRQSEKLSSLANLAAGVAHEIRNPLNAIGMAIQRLQREFAPARGEAQGEYRRFTEVLRGEVKRVNEIIEQFLFLARPARMDLQPVEVQGLLRDLLLLCRESAEQQRVTLVEDLASPVPPLPLDRQKIHQALWNLLHNALQAMPRGGRLEVSARHDPARKEAVIRIADTGEGIAEENLGKIFDYYFTTKEKGVGLGLPLAHKIVQDHGGGIEVSSQAGQGTEFSVRLPAPGEER